MFDTMVNPVFIFGQILLCFYGFIVLQLTMQNTHMLSVGNEHYMEWSVGAECWSGVLEWCQILEWQILWAPGHKKNTTG